SIKISEDLLKQFQHQIITQDDYYTYYSYLYDKLYQFLQVYVKLSKQWALQQQQTQEPQQDISVKDPMGDGDSITTTTDPSAITPTTTPSTDQSSVKFEYINITTIRKIYTWLIVHGYYHLPSFTRLYDYLINSNEIPVVVS